MRSIISTFTVGDDVVIKKTNTVGTITQIRRTGVARITLMDQTGLGHLVSEGEIRLATDEDLEIKKSSRKGRSAPKKIENKDIKSADFKLVVQALIDNFWDDLVEESAHNCCGVSELDDVADGLYNFSNISIADFKDYLEDYADLDQYDDDFPKVTKEDCLRLEAAILSEFDKTFKSNVDNNAFTTMVLVQERNAFMQKIYSILDKHAVATTPWRKNPNSGNHIKIWIF